MRLSEFNPKITAAKLNESAAKQFGQRLDLEKFTVEQLHDARNKLRTKVHELNSSFTPVHESEEYQKSKLFLDVLNTEINERENHPIVEFTDMEQLVLDKVSEGLIDFDAIPVELQLKVESVIDNDEDEISESLSEDWEKTLKHLKKHKKVKKPFALVNWMKKKGYKSHVKESVLREGEEEKAALIMSSKDMVDKITAWMEDTAQMQTEAMLDLVDSIRDEIGLEQSQSFEGAVKPALASIYAALEAAREQLNNGLAVLTGEGGTQQPMGELPPEEPVAPEMEEPTDEFAASAPATGGELETGRATRESFDYRLKKK